MQWYFCFFLVSGFCSILYEVIWLRLTMAQFGVTTAIAAIVLSAFMIGLGFGSWGAGRFVRKFEGRIEWHPLRLYAFTEFLIGISAVIVPFQLVLGKHLLQRITGQTTLSAPEHYLLAGGWIVIALVPWCACMGATFPFAMFAIRNSFGESGRAFSYLYLANVLGALGGATIPLLLIELSGFRRTLYVGAALNLLLTAGALAVSRSEVAGGKSASNRGPSQSPAGEPVSANNRKFVWLLFGTGLTSMGVEVIWIRLYTPSVSTVVYAFAAILGLYLAATYAGSWHYRRRERTQNLDGTLLWAALGFSVFIAFLTVDPRLPLPALFRVILGVAPLSGIVGFVTPMMVDLFSSGDPDRAGRAYAINIAGCVIGPLLSGFVLLPLFGERFSLCLFALPWFVAGLIYAPRHPENRSRYLAEYSVLVLSTIALAVLTEGFEEQFVPRRVVRDNTATVIATGTGHGKRLLINGVPITTLTPVTKVMAHLPLAFLERPPASALIICFGMGTSHRSALSWGIHSTAVDLVPSVPPLFPFFYPNDPIGLDSPLSKVVIDDGRSFLDRTREQYDVIVLDPPPPVGAAASSLLYSKEFYAVAKARLRPGGILQQWLPGCDDETLASVARALGESFPYVRAFGSLQHGGYHFLASMTPIGLPTANQLAQRLPPEAAKDLIEWGQTSTPEGQFQILLGLETPLTALIEKAPKEPALQDDRPVNEYFLIRKLSQPGYWKTIPQRLLGAAAISPAEGSNPTQEQSARLQ